MKSVVIGKSLSVDGNPLWCQYDLYTAEVDSGYELSLPQKTHVNRMHTPQGKNKRITLQITFSATLKIVSYSLSPFAIACRSSPPFGKFCVHWGAYCVGRRFSAAYGMLAQFIAVWGIGAAYCPALVFKGRTGQLVLNLSKFYPAFHFQLPVVYCNVPVGFHEVLFYIRNVARIHPERVLISVKHPLCGLFGNIFVVVLTLFLNFIEFIVWKLKTQACFTRIISSGNP